MHQNPEKSDERVEMIQNPDGALLYDREVLKAWIVAPSVDCEDWV